MVDESEPHRAQKSPHHPGSKPYASSQSSRLNYIEIQEDQERGVWQTEDRRNYIKDEIHPQLSYDQRNN